MCLSSCGCQLRQMGRIYSSHSMPRHMKTRTAQYCAKTRQYLRGFSNAINTCVVEAAQHMLIFLSASVLRYLLNNDASLLRYTAVYGPCGVWICAMRWFIFIVVVSAVAICKSTSRSPLSQSIIQIQDYSQALHGFDHGGWEKVVEEEIVCRAGQLEDTNGRRFTVMGFVGCILAAGAGRERPGDHAGNGREIVAIRRGDVSRAVERPQTRVTAAHIGVVEETPCACSRRTGWTRCWNRMLAPNKEGGKDVFLLPARCFFRLLQSCKKQGAWRTRPGSLGSLSETLPPPEAVTLVGLSLAASAFQEHSYRCRSAEGLSRWTQKAASSRGRRVSKSNRFLRKDPVSCSLA